MGYEFPQEHPRGQSQLHAFERDFCDLEHLGRTAVVPDSIYADYASPRGIFIYNNELYVVFQNVQKSYPGGILVFDEDTGNFKRELISPWDDHAPFAPRGAILYSEKRRGRRSGSKFIIVADNGHTTTDTHPGALRKYGLDGSYLGEIDHKNFPYYFAPRALVAGRDGKLYVTASDPRNSTVGHVLRFDVENGFEAIIATHRGTTPCDRLLRRPEGIAIGPDGRIFVVTFALTAKNEQVSNFMDGFLVFSKDGNCLDQIPFRPPNLLESSTRISAQSLIFGPQGNLYVPITSTGEIRKYNVHTYRYSVVAPGFYELGEFVVDNKTLVDNRILPPYYIYFQRNDPSTLAYGIGGRD